MEVPILLYSLSWSYRRWVNHQRRNIFRKYGNIQKAIMQKGEKQFKIVSYSCSLADCIVNKKMTQNGFEKELASTGIEICWIPVRAVSASYADSVLAICQCSLADRQCPPWRDEPIPRRVAWSTCHVSCRSPIINNTGRRQFVAIIHEKIGIKNRLQNDGRVFVLLTSFWQDSTDRVNSCNCVRISQRAGQTTGAISKDVCNWMACVWPLWLLWLPSRCCCCCCNWSCCCWCWWCCWRWARLLLTLAGSGMAEGAVGCIRNGGPKDIRGSSCCCCCCWCWCCCGSSNEVGTPPKGAFIRREPLDEFGAKTGPVNCRISPDPWSKRCNVPITGGNWKTPPGGGKLLLFVVQHDVQVIWCVSMCFFPRIQTETPSAIIRLKKNSHYKKGKHCTIKSAWILVDSYRCRTWLTKVW